MKQFENYKNNGQHHGPAKIYFMIFNTRIKRTIFNSVCAFFGGLLLTFGALYIYDKKTIPHGVGGLETSGVPEFLQNELKNGSDSKKISGETGSDTATDVSLSEASLSDESLLDAEQELQSFHGDFEADSPEHAEALLEAEKQETSVYDDSLELCYSTYRVKKGDMIGFIADNFNITQDTIISVNNIRQSRLLQIGQYLKIPSMPGIIYTVRKNGETIESIAKKYDISADKASRINKVEKEVKLNAGATLFLPDAYLDWVTRQEINGDLFHKPIRARYWLSSYYGWRSSPFNGKRSYHSGVDMACPQGTNVYAALVGTVTSTGFNNVYGNYVIVTHHSGYKTLYGHLSAILVTRGKVVDTNTRIGKVGSTGMSTGPHLHFTVYKNGKTVDPMALWK